MNIIKRVLRIVITGYLVKWIRNKIEENQTVVKINVKGLFANFDLSSE